MKGLKICLFFFIVLSSKVIAISMNQQPIEYRTIIFQPYLEREFSVYVF
ncbi:MAG: hypothetical protein KatS3mg002_1507 [Candidatus Woesearchaeota archaeon]|nr:MAG: hypothetical protein KatS3mg002_1507 [Candidatus Woesearchaeota archaeon]